MVYSPAAGAVTHPVLRCTDPGWPSGRCERASEDCHDRHRIEHRAGATSRGKHAPTQLRGQVRHMPSSKPAASNTALGSATRSRSRSSPSSRVRTSRSIVCSWLAAMVGQGRHAARGRGIGSGAGRAAVSRSENRRLQVQAEEAVSAPHRSSPGADAGGDYGDQRLVQHHRGRDSHGSQERRW